MRLLSPKHTVWEGHVEGEPRDEEMRRQSSMFSSCYPAHIRCLPHVEVFLVSYKSGNLKLKPRRTKSTCTPKIPLLSETTT